MINLNSKATKQIKATVRQIKGINRKRLSSVRHAQTIIKTLNAPDTATLSKSAAFVASVYFFYLFHNLSYNPYKAIYAMQLFCNLIQIITLNLKLAKPISRLLPSSKNHIRHVGVLQSL